VACFIPFCFMYQQVENDETSTAGDIIDSHLMEKSAGLEQRVKTAFNEPQGPMDEVLPM